MLYPTAMMDAARYYYVLVTRRYGSLPMSSCRSLNASQNLARSPDVHIVEIGIITNEKRFAYIQLLAGPEDLRCYTSQRNIFSP